MVPPRGRPYRLRLYFGVRPALLGSAGFWNGWGRGGRAALTLQDFVPRSGRSPPWGVEMATAPENQSLGERHRRVLAVLAKAPRDLDANALRARGVRVD